MITRTNPIDLTDPEMAAQRAGILRALGNPVRLRIVACLVGSGEQAVGALRDTLQLPQSSISRQLSWLRLHELVTVRRDGGFSYYSVAIPQLAVLLGCLEQCCTEQPAEDHESPGDVN